VRSGGTGRLAIAPGSAGGAGGAHEEEPQSVEAKKRSAQAAADQLARMTTLAGRHFNRGQRAFFFALGYLGWFISAWVFMAATAAVLVVIAIRQFGSRRA
jgi:uncharacterized membrane protein